MRESVCVCVCVLVTSLCSSILSRSSLACSRRSTFFLSPSTSSFKRLLFSRVSLYTHTHTHTHPSLSFLISQMSSLKGDLTPPVNETRSTHVHRLKNTRPEKSMSVPLSLSLFLSLSLSLSRRLYDVGPRAGSVPALAESGGPAGGEGLCGPHTLLLCAAGHSAPPAHHRPGWYCVCVCACRVVLCVCMCMYVSGGIVCVYVCVGWYCVCV